MSVEALMNDAQATVLQNIQQQYLFQLENAPTPTQSAELGLSTQSTISTMSPNS
jgi:hypothetical protein